LGRGKNYVAADQKVEQKAEQGQVTAAIRAIQHADGEFDYQRQGNDGEQQTDVLQGRRQNPGKRDNGQDVREID